MSMKFGSLLFSGMLLAVSPLMAGLTLDFDATLHNNPSLSDSNIFVTFTAKDATMTVNGNSLSFSGGAISGTTNPAGTVGDITSTSFSLTELKSGGVTIDSANSLAGIISYGGKDGFSNQSSAPSPFTTMTRYSNFELTYNFGTSPGADLTNINQFGGALRLEALDSSNALKGHVQNFKAKNQGGIQTTAAMMDALARVAGPHSDAVIRAKPPHKTTKEVIRVIGPSSFNPADPGQTNPYRSFSPYFKKLHDKSSGTASSASLQNLVPGAPAGGQGALGLTAYQGSAHPTFVGKDFNGEYYFETFVIHEGGDNYRVELKGHVVAVGAADPSEKIVYGLDGDNKPTLTISIPAAGIDQFIYMQPNNPTGVTYGGDWSQITTDFPGVTNPTNAVELQRKILGDFTEGMLTGMIGSEHKIDFQGEMKEIGDLPSSAWWLNGLDAYPVDTAALANPFSHLIFINSSGSNTGVSGQFEVGGVYANPFDDRFSTQLLPLGNDITTLRVTMLEDGALDLVIPEPSHYAMLAGVVGLLAVVYLRRRR